MKVCHRGKEFLKLCRFACMTVAIDIWFLHIVPVRRFARLQASAFGNLILSYKCGLRVLQKDISMLAGQFEILGIQQQKARISSAFPGEVGESHDTA